VSPCRGPHAVTDSAHGFQVLGISRIELDFLAQAADIDIHRARCDEAQVAPYGVEKLVAGEDQASVPGQVVQQPEFGGRDRHRLAAYCHGQSAAINFDLAGPEQRRRERAFKPSQYGLQARD